VDEKFEQKNQEEKDLFISSKNIPSPYFLFVGKRSLYKNFDKLVKAFANWENKNEFMIISIGGGAFTDKEFNLINVIIIGGCKFNLVFWIDRRSIFVCVGHSRF
jgi:phosphomevalonate kinase